MDAIKGRLEGFLTQWRITSGGDRLGARLVEFLEQAAPLLRRAEVGRPSPAPTAAGLRAILPQLGAALRRTDRDLAAANPWGLAGLGRREVRNAAVLAGLWTPSRMGGLAQTFLAEFLDRVEVPEGSSLPDRAELALGYVVRTEHCPGHDGADRVDIVVETARHLVGIEIKIGAVEGDRQLDRYVAALARSVAGADRVPTVMLLGPNRPSRPDVPWANWATLRAAIGATLPRRRRDRSFGHHLLDRFARHVGAF